MLYLSKVETAGELFNVANGVKSQAEADEFFEAYVLYCMEAGDSREVAENKVRQNLGYVAGYYDDETRARIEKLYKCEHPIFGPIADGKPTPEKTFQMGVDFASK